MSSLVPELKQIVDRILVVAPDVKQLKELFEILSFELVSGPGAAQKMDLTTAALPEGPIRYWASFTLGRRAGAIVRLSLMGVPLDALNENAELFDIADAFFVWMPGNGEGAEKLMGLKVSAEARHRPFVAVGLETEGAEAGASTAFPRKALIEWISKNFDQVRHLPKEDKFLTEGLEWVLSF